MGRSSSGDFVVVWHSIDQLAAGYTSVIGQRFSAAGAPLGSEFVVRVSGAGPAVAASSAGFVVTWAEGGALDNEAVFARRYDGSGAPLGSAFRVDDGAAPLNAYSRIATDTTGNFVVVWDAFPSIMAQRYSGVSGAPLGQSFRVVTSGYHQTPDVATTGPGSFTVAWRGIEDLSSFSDVYAQRYCGALAGDADGNDVVNVADVFWLINSLFAGGPQPVRGCDANGDGKTDVADVFYLINFLFAGGKGPACTS
ncbi:MAG TPA: dockerin type I domain-containing protein [Thermoanaerobaculia bacterium]|nr:dockerin type I domain-containing protein [Thermoanaerobaculia bacterium]